MPVRRTLWPICMLPWMLALAACVGGAASTPTRPPATPRVTGEIIVFAGISLTDAFQEIARAFQQAHPGTQVVFNFTSSVQLRIQLAQGAKADVFAPADWKNMQDAQQDGTIVGEPKVFVRNEPVVVVPANNPARIDSFRDLARPGVRLVLGAPGIAIRTYTQQILQKASQDPQYGGDFVDRVLANVVSEEPTVKAALTKVALGEVDATFVFRTDATTPDMRDKVKIIEIPPPLNVTAEYPIAVVKNAPNPTGAQAFIDFVLSPEGQRILARWGFQTVR